MNTKNSSGGRGSGACHLAKYRNLPAVCGQRTSTRALSSRGPWSNALKLFAIRTSKSPKTLVRLLRSSPDSAVFGKGEIGSTPSQRWARID